MLENIPLNVLGNRAKIKKSAEFFAEKFYTESGLADQGDYSKNELISLCINALDFPYEISGKAVKPADWKNFRREKRFYHHLSSSSYADYYMGIGDGIFTYNEKIYLLDWKSDRGRYENGKLVLDLSRLTDPELVEYTQTDYRYQILLYSLNVHRNLETLGRTYSDFGGILYIYLRNIGKGIPAVLVKPSGEEIKKFERNPWKE